MYMPYLMYATSDYENNGPHSITVLENNAPHSITVLLLYK